VMSKPMLFDTCAVGTPDSLSRQGRGRNPTRRSNVTQGVAVLLVVAALGCGSAYAGLSAREANPGTPSPLADVPSGGTPVPLIGKVTTVSARRHYLVIDSGAGPIIITKRTTFRLIRTGLGGVALGRTVRVRAVKVNGRFYAIALERTIGELPRTL